MCAGALSIVSVEQTQSLNSPYAQSLDLGLHIVASTISSRFFVADRPRLYRELAINCKLS